MILRDTLQPRNQRTLDPLAHFPIPSKGLRNSAMGLRSSQGGFTASIIIRCMPD